ncbi:fungal-specific transcription factor domain-containing protein [Aspergillus carlsbadensis]|nr:fungal-specific transcription factor domain-containing protein [Aspergillus carlsbadensis]
MSADTQTSTLDCSSGAMPFGYTVSHHSSENQQYEGLHQSPPIASSQHIEGGQTQLAFALDDVRLIPRLIASESTGPGFTSGPVNYSTCYAYQQPATDVPAEVTYHYYPFIMATELRRIPPQDLHFLDLQGCLLVPTQPLLDEFIKQYFLHVHPVLPLINEGDFWELYDLNSRPSPDKCIPLLVLQAMLFAASAFVSPSTLQSLRHPNGRSMRITLLRRAKLLSDLKIESSPIAIAQAAVLLSTASMSSSGRLNTTWLSLAIENALLAEAHLYATLTSASNLRKRRMFKRIWWCCILRDRSMALLLKRPVHICGKQFDLTNDPLGMDDLRDEFERSKVYGSYTKWKLAKVVSQSAQLCIKMTELLILFNPGYLKPRMSQPELRKGRLLLDRCRSDLRAWKAQAELDILSSAPPAGSEALASTALADEHGSVTLYTNLVYLYYHAACIALCHLEVFYSDMNCSHTASRATASLPVNTQTQDELQTAISSITDCHEELLSRDLAQWLPQAALAFIGFPLILNILNINLTPPSMETTHNNSWIPLYRRTSVFIHFMEAYRAKYEGVDWFGDIVRHIGNLARLGASTMQTGLLHRLIRHILLVCTGLVRGGLVAIDPSPVLVE